jgi:glycosyltransferase involved in cell wall biosynthesis
MSQSDVFLSVVVRVQNAAGFVAPALRRLIAVMEANFRHYEILLVDDASTDATSDIIRAIQAEARNIQLYRLARSQSDNVALTAGLDHAIGDLIATLDLYVDPPELLPAMAALATGETHVVYALPRERRERQGAYNRLLNGFITLLSLVNGLEVPAEVSGYRLVTRAVLTFMLGAPDRHRTLMLLPALSGYGHAAIDYDRMQVSPTAGRGRAWRAVSKALDVTFATSTRPLRIITVMSLGISVLALLYAVLVVLISVFKDDVAKGWASLSLQISGLFFLVCIILAVMSEYLLQVLETARGQARYHIATQSHSQRMALAEPRIVVETAEPRE